MGFGIVTMAPSRDALVRASAMAASARSVGESAPIALITSPSALVPLPELFDHILRFDEPEPFSGSERYLNKLVHPLQMSPFERSFFIDDDVLVRAPLSPIVEEHFYGHALAISTQIHAADEAVDGTNLLDPIAMCAALGLDRIQNVAGGGHMYWESGSEADRIASRALEVATDRARYEHLAGQSIVSDEIAIAIVANEERLPMPILPDFVDPLNLDRANSITIDIERGTYEWPGREWGLRIEEVAMIHFCTKGKRALPYRREIHRLTGLRQSFDEGVAGSARRLRMRARLLRGR